MAVSAARSKIAPLPSACARCWAPLKTFSNTRGTASRKSGRSIASFLEQLQTARREPDAHPGGHTADLDEPGEDVGEGQEQQGRLPGVEVGAGDRQDLGDVPHEVLVGDDAALGTSGRPGGVDDGGEVAGHDVGPPGLDLGRVDMGAVALDLLDAALVDDEGWLASGQLVRDLVVDRLQRCVGADDGRGPRVRDDPLDLLGRRRLVDRHGDTPGRPDGVVEQGPLEPCGAHEADLRTGLDAQAGEALRDGGDLVGELARGPVHELVADPVGQGRTLR